MIVAGLRAKAKSYFDGEQSRQAYAGASNSPQALKIRLLHPIATRAGALRVFYGKQTSELKDENTTLRGDLEISKAENFILKGENSELRNGFSEILDSSAISALKYVKNPDPFDNKLNSLLHIKEIATELSGKKNGQPARE